MTQTKTQRLRELIQDEKLLQVPGCYDGMTAHLIKKVGFDAAYISGAGISMSVLGIPDMNTVSYEELKGRVFNITGELAEIPVIVDIDTGFGAPLNLVRLVRDFERIGVCGVQIEDQTNPKRCGHTKERGVVSCEEMCKRIYTILDTRSSDDGLVVIARTDSRTALGIDEAIARGNKYLEYGADVIFIESPETVEEVERIGREIKGPVVFNNIEGGRSPFMSRDDLQRMGFAMAIYPNSMTRIMMKAGYRMLKEIKEAGTNEALWPEMLTHKALFELFDFPKLKEEEEKYK